MFWLLKLAGMVTFELGATLNRNKPLLQKSRTQRRRKELSYKKYVTVG
jgi:hypothetical protein